VVRFLPAPALLLMPVSAQAACVYDNFVFHPEKNDGVVVDAIVDAGSSCAHNFAEGPGYKFTGKISGVTIELKEMKKTDLDDAVQSRKAAALKKGLSD